MPASLTYLFLLQYPSLPDGCLVLFVPACVLEVFCARACVCVRGVCVCVVRVRERKCV